MMSHERIYQYFREDKLNGREMYKHLRHKLKHGKRPDRRNTTQNY